MYHVVIHSSFGKCDIDCCSNDVLSSVWIVSILKFPINDGKEIRLLFIWKLFLQNTLTLIKK